MWYTEDLARFRSERQNIDALALQANWISAGTWRFDEQARIIYDADIIVGERIFSVSLRFPSTFPESPPSVFPRDKDAKWSKHQFGKGGELCLQYRMDNWTPDLTGRQVLESAYRLLSQENPETGPPVTVPSAHRQTDGQMLRGSTFRFLIRDRDASILADLQEGAAISGTAIGTWHERDVVFVSEKLTGADSTEFDVDFPTALSNAGRRYDMCCIRLPKDAPFPGIDSIETIQGLCASYGGPVKPELVVAIREHAIKAFLAIGATQVTPVAYILDELDPPRQQEDHLILPSRSVALIGCGSLGSKVAASLARAGVGNFVLIDDDIFLPGNIIRNDLDWREVGQHKVDAVKARILLVNPRAKVETWRVQLGGQESSASVESFLSLVKDCDLILDATASADNLNVLSGIARAGKKPMIWAEIFGGGVGGLVVRSRPGIDLPPQYARRAIENWFGEAGSVPIRSHRRYETGEEGPPLIADDADVSVIAAHTARFAIDLLADREESIFPHSAYAIGLSKGSIFDQPFDTRPIDVSNTLTDEAPAELSAEETQAEIANIVQMFAKKAS